LSSNPDAPRAQGRPTTPPPKACAPELPQQATCQFCGRRGRVWRRYCMASPDRDRVNDAMMSMLYQAYQNQMDLTSPWRTGAAAALKYLNLAPQGVSEKAFG